MRKRITLAVAGLLAVTLLAGVGVWQWMRQPVPLPVISPIWASYSLGGQVYVRQWIHVTGVTQITLPQPISEGNILLVRLIGPGWVVDTAENTFQPVGNGLYEAVVKHTQLDILSCLNCDTPMIHVVEYEQAQK